MWAFLGNFGISEKIEKIETFISENLKIFGYDLNFLMWTPPILISEMIKFYPHMVLSRWFIWRFQEPDWLYDASPNKLNLVQWKSCGYKKFPQLMCQWRNSGGGTLGDSKIGLRYGTFFANLTKVLTKIWVFARNWYFS